MFRAGANSQRPRHQALERALRLMVFVSAVLVSSKAMAATLAVAPMCDQSAASMPAPIPALPNATGKLSAVSHCDGRSEWLLSPRAPKNSAEQPTWQASDRALPTPFSLVNLVGVKRPVTTASAHLVLPGFAVPVYRPPR